MRAISLFSGVGGFEIGFERAGIKTVLQAESDPWCLSVLERHWPDVERVRDVRQVDEATLQGRCRDVVSVGVGSDAERLGVARRGRDDADGADRACTDGDLWPGANDGGWYRPGHSVDLVYGGFPCQDVSVAGKRAGLSGNRSGLWFEFERVLSELRPRWCVVENVPGLLSSNGGADFSRVLRGLGDLGYGWAYRVLDARWFGVPQRRRRVFVVGCLGDQARAAQVLAVCESCGGHSAAGGQAGEDVAPTLDDSARGVSVELPMIDIARSQTARNERIDAETENLLVAGALRASDGHHGHSSPRGDGMDNLVRVSGSQGVRRLTPLECERLMGWPDEWTRYTVDGKEISDSHRYRMCGNGVVATVAEWIGHRLVVVDRMSAPVSAL